MGINYGVKTQIVLEGLLSEGKISEKGEKIIDRKHGENP